MAPAAHHADPRPAQRPHPHRRPRAPRGRGRGGDRRPHRLARPRRRRDGVDGAADACDRRRREARPPRLHRRAQPRRLGSNDACDLDPATGEVPAFVLSYDVHTGPLQRLERGRDGPDDRHLHGRHPAPSWRRQALDAAGDDQRGGRGPRLHDGLRVRQLAGARPRFTDRRQGSRLRRPLPGHPPLGPKDIPGTVAETVVVGGRVECGG